MRVSFFGTQCICKNSKRQNDLERWVKVVNNTHWSSVVSTVWPLDPQSLLGPEILAHATYHMLACSRTGSSNSMPCFSLEPHKPQHHHHHHHHSQDTRHMTQNSNSCTALHRHPRKICCCHRNAERHRNINSNINFCFESILQTAAATQINNAKNKSFTTPSYTSPSAHLRWTCHCPSCHCQTAAATQINNAKNESFTTPSYTSPSAHLRWTCHCPSCHCQTAAATQINNAKNESCTTPSYTSPSAHLHWTCHCPSCHCQTAAATQINNAKNESFTTPS